MLLLVLSACTGTITTNTQWSGSWEKTCAVTVSYVAGDPETIVVNVNGCLLPRLARGEQSARSTIHLLGLPGLYVAVATEAEGLLVEQMLPFEAEAGDELALHITGLSVSGTEATLTCDVERL